MTDSAQSAAVPPPGETPQAKHRSPLGLFVKLAGLLAWNLRQLLQFIFQFFPVCHILGCPQQLNRQTI